MELNTYKHKSGDQIEIQKLRRRSENKNAVVGTSRGFAIAEASLTLFFFFSIFSMFFASSLLIEKRKKLMLSELKKDWIEMDKKYEN